MPTLLPGQEMWHGCEHTIIRLLVIVVINIIIFIINIIIIVAIIVIVIDLVVVVTVVFLSHFGTLEFC